MGHAERAQDGLPFGVPRQHDANGARESIFDLLEERRSVHAWHAHVRHHHVERSALALGDGGLAPQHEYHLPFPALLTKPVPQPVEDRRFVVNK